MADVGAFQLGVLAGFGIAIPVSAIAVPIVQWGSAAGSGAAPVLEQERPQ